MLDRAELKAKAKNQLGNDIFGSMWLSVLAVFVIVSAVITILNGVSIIVVGPLTFGFSLILLKLVRGSGSVEYSDLIEGFKRDFGGTFLLGLLQSLFIFLWTLLFIIPGIIKSYSYSMCFYIKIDHPEYDWRACLDESARITKGHKWELFVLDLSFIGWYILGSLALGIGTLWVVPYHQMTVANAYEELKNN